MSGYQLKLEKNYLKSRVCIYLKNSIEYLRKTDMEGKNSHLLVIGLIGNLNAKRIININRSLYP